MQHFWEYVELEGYSIYSTPESGIAGRAGIAGIVVIDSDNFGLLFRNRMISVPFELEQVEFGILIQGIPLPEKSQKECGLICGFVLHLGPIMARYNFLNGHLQRKRYQNTVQVKVKCWEKVAVSHLWRKNYQFSYYFLKDGVKCRFLPKIYICILLGQDDIATE